MTNILDNEQYQIARYNFISKYEGYKPVLYLDSRGFLTTGTGYLLARGYVTPKQKLNSNIIQSSMVTAISNSIGGYTDSQQRVIDITAEVISQIQTSNPNYIFSNVKYLSTFKQTDYGQLLSDKLKISYDNTLGTWSVVGIRESDGSVTPVSNIFTSESQNRSAFVNQVGKYENVVSKAIDAAGIDVTLEQRVAMVSAAWNSSNSPSNIANSIADGASGNTLYSSVAKGRSELATDRYHAEVALLGNDPSVVPGYISGQGYTTLGGIYPASKYNTPPASTYSVNHYTDGSTTYEGTITADKANALLEEGASFSQTYNPDGSLSSSVIYHQNGITESNDISADGTKSYAKWVNGKLVKLVSTQSITDASGAVIGAKVVGEFVLGGQRYNADGTPIVAAGSIDPIPPSIDPNTISPRRAHSLAVRRMLTPQT